MKRVIVLFLFLVAGNQMFSQEQKMVKYFTGFSFQDGIYINFLDFKQNSPVPAYRFANKVSPSAYFIYEELIQLPELLLITSTGDTVAIQTDAIWGYSVNNYVYIQTNGNFSRIHQIGALSHFVGKKIVVENTYVDPTSMYWRNQTMRTQTTREEMQEYVLDFESGSIVEFDLKTIEGILKRDLELFDEFNQLNPKKKKQLKFFYLKKYNERNPIYFPIN
jgi:hypothetical protein